MRVLDLFAGQLGWSRAFLARGWEAVAVDLVAPESVPPNCEFWVKDVLEISARDIRNDRFDFICASSPCEEFSVWGMRHFHPNPKHPETGIKLFEHTRAICEKSGVAYVMENVRAAQKFVGQAVHHCGAFHLWGNAVPPLLPKGIIKGWEHKYVDSKGISRGGGPGRYEWSTSEGRRAATAKISTIPPELANCVAEYAERILDGARSR